MIFRFEHKSHTTINLDKINCYNVEFVTCGQKEYAYFTIYLDEGRINIHASLEDTIRFEKAIQDKFIFCGDNQDSIIKDTMDEINRNKLQLPDIFPLDDDLPEDDDPDSPIILEKPTRTEES